MRNNPTAWQKIRTSFMLVWAGALHSGQFVLNCSTCNTTWGCRVSSPRQMSPVRLKTLRWYVGGGEEDSHWTASVSAHNSAPSSKEANVTHFISEIFLFWLLFWCFCLKQQRCKSHVGTYTSASPTPCPRARENALACVCHLPPHEFNKKLESKAPIKRKTEFKITATAKLYCKVYPKSLT